MVDVAEGRCAGLGIWPSGCARTENTAAAAPANAASRTAAYLREVVNGPFRTNLRLRQRLRLSQAHRWPIRLAASDRSRLTSAASPRRRARHRATDRA